MRYKFCIASLWPGCWQAWQGDWRGLALALGFAVALNGAFIESFGSPQRIGVGLPQSMTGIMCWVVVAGLWSCGLVWLWREWAGMQVPTSATSQEELEAQFQQAQHEYLRGHWIEAETLLAGLLRGNCRDVEVRLLLASVQRRTKRWAESRETLERLKDDPLAARWLPEVDAELARIDELESETNDKPHEESGGEGTLMQAA